MMKERWTGSLLALFSLWLSVGLLALQVPPLPDASSTLSAPDYAGDGRMSAVVARFTPADVREADLSSLRVYPSPDDQPGFDGPFLIGTVPPPVHSNDLSAPVGLGTGQGPGQGAPLGFRARAPPVAA
jgi:hypothetical protein